MDIQKIQSLLPHRYPFLLVDRVIESEPGKRLVAIKNVTINEPFFPGHFPSKPVMPGVLVIEAMAQATGLLAMESADVPEEAIYYLVGVDKARFKQPVVPGDQLRLSVTVSKQKRGIWVFDTEAAVPLVVTGPAIAFGEESLPLTGVVSADGAALVSAQGMIISGFSQDDMFTSSPPPQADNRVLVITRAIRRQA